MYKQLWVMIICIVALGACGATDNNEEVRENQDLSPIEHVAFDTKESAPTDFNFSKFDLEVDYVDSLSYDIDYEENGERTKVDINEIGEESITGQEALNQLIPHFREMNFDEDSTQEEVIEEVISILGLDETYKEFKLEVTYRNGIEAEYED